MSNRRRPKIKPVHNSGPPPTPGPGEAWATQVAIVSNRDDKAAVEYAMQASHDQLIDLLGPARRSGVRWTQYYAGEGRRVYEQLHADVDLTPEQQAYLVEGRRRLEDPRSLLIVAWAIGQVPPGTVLA